MAKTVSKDTPLAEITLRKYEKPSMKGRELGKRLCLSLGLLQPGDSRDIIIDVLYVMLKAKTELSSEEVRDKVVQQRKRMKLPLKGVASSNVRRQLLRLRGMFIVEKVANNYRITENEKLISIFEEKVEKYLLPSIVERVKDYLKAAEKL